ncbi:MAG: cysteine--tRNA ligase [Candidatus Omnitrophica bacterium]|nr:cysteine--tRNA ligase [Candidatus Omnitrophota bacterium]
MNKIAFFNTLKKRQEIFSPLKKNRVTMYSCGPTVYDYAHIGNFRTYIFQDLLRRFLEYCGYTVIQVMNITDVDDKTIAGANREGVTLAEYTAKYTDAFLEDLARLNIERPEHMPRATESIDDMITMIQTLIKKKHAYESNGSVYFKIDTFKHYGKLSGKDLAMNIQGARIDSDEYEKDNLSDFVLWKAKKEGEPSWESPFGPGRPGWHIECSAMSMKEFGATFDMHTGGEDLIFPHHENEIAQSEACTGKPFVRYWLHCKFLLVDGEKMSKSKGNFYTLRDLIAKGHDPISIRYLLLSHNYRQPLNFTLEGIEQSKKAVQRINEFIKRMESHKVNNAISDEGDVLERVTACKAAFCDALADDLNIAEALAQLFNAVRIINNFADTNQIGKRTMQEIEEFITMIDAIIAVRTEHDVEVPNEILELVNGRQKARQERNFAEADRLRDLLTQKGWIVKDTKDGPVPERL